MSAKVVNFVLENSKMTGSARLLLVVLADMSNNDGECWPGKSSLARRVNVSTRQIIRLVQECERKGELRVLPPDTLGGQNHYLIIGIAPDARVRRARTISEKKPRIRRVDVSTDTGVSSDTRVTPLVTPVSPKPSTQPNTLKRVAPAKAAAPPVPELTPEQLFDLAANGYQSRPVSNDVAKVLVDKPTRKRNPKPVDPDNEAIVAIIDAWLKASRAIDPAAYAKPINRDCARQMHREGYTADDVAAYVPIKAQEPYWYGKTVPFTAIAKDIGAWKASQNEDSRAFSPSGLHVFKVQS